MATLPFNFIAVTLQSLYSHFTVTLFIEQDKDISLEAIFLNYSQELSPVLRKKRKKEEKRLELFRN
jgi:ribosome maturation factor RimP